MSVKRSYRDPCGIARALDVVGDRWALLVVRELVLGPKRFTDLRAGLPEVAPDVLSLRLRELEDAGVLRRRRLPVPAASRVYELTDWGAELEPALLALGRWGSRAPRPVEHRELGVDAFILALKTMFDPARASTLEASYDLDLDGEAFRAVISGGSLSVTRGATERPDARIETSVPALLAVLFHGGSLPAAIADGSIQVTGSRAVVARFARSFRAPVPVAA